MKAGEIMMRYQQDTLDLHHKLVIAKKDSEVKKANFFVMIALTISLFIALAASIYMAYSRKIKLQTQMKMLELRLTSIRNRISPHFIFNVLNHENENNHLEMNQLTQLLRESIDLSHLNTISLATELNFVSKYIELEKHVMGNDFEFKIIAPTHNIMEHIIIPPMLIQILVENSIKHGLKGLERHKKLIIEIQSLVNGTNIYVRDNGRGFYIQTENSRTKTGLNIIRQSILINNQRNKQKMEFKIHNIIENDKIIGCEAFIHIPNNLKLADSINN
jgi:Putative regulator of cell autolysis